MHRPEGAGETLALRSPVRERAREGGPSSRTSSGRGVLPIPGGKNKKAQSRQNPGKNALPFLLLPYLLLVPVIGQGHLSRKQECLGVIVL